MYLIRRLGAYFVPFWRHIAVSMLCMVVVGATAGVSAWLVKPVMDDIFIRQDAVKLRLIPVAIVDEALARRLWQPRMGLWSG